MIQNKHFNKDYLISHNNVICKTQLKHDGYSYDNLIDYAKQNNIEYTGLIKLDISKDELETYYIQQKPESKSQVSRDLNLSYKVIEKHRLYYNIEYDYPIFKQRRFIIERLKANPIITESELKQLKISQSEIKKAAALHNLPYEIILDNPNTYYENKKLYIKEDVLRQHLKARKTKVQLQKELNVSRNIIDRSIKKYNINYSYIPHKSKPIEMELENTLIKWLNENPDKYANEIAKEFNITIDAVKRIIKSHNHPYKFKTKQRWKTMNKQMFEQFIKSMPNITYTDIVTYIEKNYHSKVTSARIPEICKYYDIDISKYYTPTTNIPMPTRQQFIDWIITQTDVTMHSAACHFTVARSTMKRWLSKWDIDLVMFSQSRNYKENCYYHNGICLDLSNTPLTNNCVITQKDLPYSEIQTIHLNPITLYIEYNNNEYITTPEEIITRYIEQEAKHAEL